MRVAVACATIGLLISCDDPPEQPLDPAVTYLPVTAQLARASMALRGVRPSLLDLKVVAEEPAQLPRLIDVYLASRELGATVREVHNEALRVKTQHPNYTPPSFGPLEGKSASEVTAAIFDEPLRLIEDVVMNDRPYTEIVTADYTMANPLVASAWGLPHGEGDGWERTKFSDGRGAAGILATNGFSLRYRSTAFNYNRGRANAISRGLLCHDFLDGEIHLDTKINLADPAVVSKAVVANPSCAGCHQTLDPLASYFFGYLMGPLIVYEYPLKLYDETKSGDWQLSTGRPPGYFGAATEPGRGGEGGMSGLPGLGQAIAEDPRFARCAVLHFASYLLETPMKELPVAWVASLHEDFVAGGYSIKQLIRAIVLSPRFAAGSHRDPGGAERLVGYQRARPQQLGRMIAALTGYAWTDGAVELLDDDLQGFRVLAGGIDSYYVTEPVHTMNATSSLVTRRLALAAAAFVVAHDQTHKARRLFRDGDLGATSERAVRRQLAHLHGRIFSELVGEDAQALDDEVALFRGVVAGGGDAARAWTITVAAMLGDLRAVYF
jgi:Protein of unknown function (DUF1585)